MNDMPPSPGPQHAQVTMTSRIVTSTYRYKRPPRKRKAVPLEGPAIVRPGRRAAAEEAQRLIA